MGWTDRIGLRGILLALILWGAASTAHAQPVREADEQTAAEQAAAEDAALEAEIQQRHRGFDILARSFSKKKRSELINLKSYTDAEWAQLEAGVKANNAACRKGDAAACLAAGRAYESGDGVWIVSAISFILYRDACDAGLGEGCRAFVDLANSGYGYPEGGMAETEGMNQRACDLGDLVSCDRFAEELGADDTSRADAVRDAACTAGGNEACVSLGNALLERGTPEDTARAFAVLDAACLRGDANACTALAGWLERQAEPDQIRVNRYSHYACYAGNDYSCDAMGLRAWRGIGLAADRALAVQYYAKGCELRDFGCETPQRLAQLPQHQAGCERGDIAACADLGLALADYASPEYDVARAAPLLERACLAGVGRACAPAAVAIARVEPRSEGSARIGALHEAGCAAGAVDACFERARQLANTPDTLDRAAEIYSRLCDAQERRACEEEERLVGLVASARIRPAGDNFVAPLQPNAPGDPLVPGEVMEVCFTGSERFRGKTYTQFNCDRGEKGINSDRARPGQAPWQALLWRPEAVQGRTLSPAQRVLCGGSLIAQGWVLTAAHCLTDLGNDLADPAARKDYRIRLGVYNSASDEGISYPILRVIRHPQYDPTNRYVFDIALVEYGTRGAVPGSEGGFRNPIRTIALDPLPIGTRKITAGMPVFAFGWGWTEAELGTATDHLQIMAMDLTSEATCTARTGFTRALGNAALCALGKNREATCKGDSGGPLVHYDAAASRPVLIGVVSSGVKCGTTGSPSRHTRIAKVRDWIATYVPGVR
jgi:TPR repeat protein